MKTCTKCNQTKALTGFSKNSGQRDGLETQCKMCRCAASKKYRKNNRAKTRTYRKKYYKNNPEKAKENANKWRKNNPEKVRASARKRSKRPEYKKKANLRQKERYHTDPQFKLKRNLRNRLRKALKGKNKSASTMTLVGCSISHLKDHLTKQFLPGMTWENHGTWHVDHIMPCASFDLTDPEQQRRFFHYTNLQPLWGPENISKRDKIIYNRTWTGTKWINKKQKITV